jgi:polysaccharide biosynthesis protein PslH
VKILIIASGLPYPVDHGRRIRMFYLYSALAKWYDIHWVCGDESAQETDIEATKNLFQRVSVIRHSDSDMWLRKFYQRYIPYIKDRELGRYISKISQSEDFDLVIIDSETIAPYVTDCNTKKPKLLNTHNLPSLLESRSARAAANLRIKLFYWRRYLAAKLVEKIYFIKFDAITLVSEKETEIFTKSFPSNNTFCIPNGIDPQKMAGYQDMAGLETDKIIVFIGPLTYFPNKDAVNYFCSSIFPRILQKDKGIKLKLIGKDSDNYGQSFYSHLPITGLGFVEDPYPLLSTARLLIAPFRIGGGTRIKILESLALGKPVVATSIGAEGIEIGEDGGLFRADTVEQFAETVTELLHYSPQECSQLCLTGQKDILEHYTWKNAVTQLDRVIQILVNGKSPF